MHFREVFGKIFTKKPARTSHRMEKNAAVFEMLVSKKVTKETKIEKKTKMLH